jgi:hypothetical protein
MAAMQQKLVAQLPTFMQGLQALPMGLPSVHVAVVSSDMGATSDSSIGCSAVGDDGEFFSMPERTCPGTTLISGATFITDDAGEITKNFTVADPAGIASVFQCIGFLGSSGCGFGHQLDSIDRALGADGLGPPPIQNEGFLRACSKSALGEAAKHETDHGDVDHRLAGFGEVLVVFAQAALTAEPPKGALDDPPTR